MAAALIKIPQPAGPRGPGRSVGPKGGVTSVQNKLSVVLRAAVYKSNGCGPRLRPQRKLKRRKMAAAAHGRRQPAGKPLGSREGRLTPQRDGPPLEGRLGGRMFTIL